MTTFFVMDPVMFVLMCCKQVNDKSEDKRAIRERKWGYIRGIL